METRLSCKRKQLRKPSKTRYSLRLSGRSVETRLSCKRKQLRKPSKTRYSQQDRSAANRGRLKKKKPEDDVIGSTMIRVVSIEFLFSSEWGRAVATLPFIPLQNTPVSFQNEEESFFFLPKKGYFQTTHWLIYWTERDPGEHSINSFKCIRCEFQEASRVVRPIRICF